MLKTATPFDRTVAMLNVWRQEDHADNIKLTRNDVITLLEGIKKDRSDLQTHVEATVETENRIIDAEFRATELLTALKQIVSQIEDYERVNNLAPNPGRKHCWDSVLHAHELIARVDGLQLTAANVRGKP